MYYTQFTNSVKKNIKLSIVIPSFNRDDHLKILLKELSKNKKKNFEIIILHNNPKQFLDKKFFDKNLKNINYEYYVTKKKIKATTNVLNSFKFGKARFIYVVGDSKLPAKNFIDNIEENIKKNPKVKILFYKNKSKLNKDIIIRNYNDLDNYKIFLGDFILIGNFVISRTITKKFFLIAKKYRPSLVPQLIFFIKSLMHQEEILLSSKILIRKFLTKSKNIDPDNNLQLIDFWVNSPMILRIVRNEEFRSIISKKIYEVDDELLRFCKYLLKKILIEKVDIGEKLDFFKYRFRYSFKYLIEVLCIYPIKFLNLILRKMRYFK